MPKILDSPKEKLLERAKTIMLTEGVPGLTVRRLAKDCGMAAGTVYNYFPSKEHIAAEIMVKDWAELTEGLGASPGSPMEGIEEIFLALRRFSSVYGGVWSSFSVRGSVTSLPYHSLLVSRIEGLLSRVIPKEKTEEEPFLLTFLAEMLLRLSQIPGVEPDTFRSLAEKLLA
ncbi:MAG: TetR/AcrR family transcriptional regulator [Firmicutes bacterium]|nr:TetR/AcrR family transcriptional regulator [Bacillota bacterium]